MKIWGGGDDEAEEAQREIAARQKKVGEKTRAETAGTPNRGAGRRASLAAMIVNSDLLCIAEILEEDAAGTSDEEDAAHPRRARLRQAAIYLRQAFQELDAIPLVRPTS